MKKILIIGNGFDISLGLKTGYADFIKSIDFLKLTGKDNTLALFLQSKFKNANWIDIELALLEYIDRKVNPKNQEKFKLEYFNLCAALTNYLNTLNFEKIDKESNAYRFLLDNILLNSELKNFVIYDFNYTSTAEKILREVGIDSPEISKYLIKMHGNLDSNNIIFGLHDNVGGTMSHTLVKKGHQPGFKSTNLSNDIRKFNDVHIFGYSLGKTDEMYFKDAFNTIRLGDSRVKKVIYKIHYHGKDALLKFKNRIDDLVDGDITPFKDRVEFDEVDTSI